MLIKQDGNLQKRHYIYIYILHTCIHIYIYIYALYIVHICTFTIMYMSKRGVLGSADDDIAFFSAYSVNFSGHLLFCWSWACFLANTCIFYIFIIRYWICLHISTLFYCSWKDLFEIYMHILHICSTIYMEDTGRSKNASNFLDF